MSDKDAGKKSLDDEKKNDSPEDVNKSASTVGLPRKVSPPVLVKTNLNQSSPDRVPTITIGTQTSPIVGTETVQVCTRRIISPSATVDTRPGAEVKARKKLRDAKQAEQAVARATLAAQRREASRKQASPYRRVTLSAPLCPDSRRTVILPEPFVDLSPGADVRARVKRRAELRAAAAELRAKAERQVRVRSTSPAKGRRFGTPIPLQGTVVPPWRAQPRPLPHIPVIFHAAPRRLQPVRFRRPLNSSSPDPVMPPVLEAKEDRALQDVAETKATTGSVTSESSSDENLKAYLYGSLSPAALNSRIASKLLKKKGKKSAAVSASSSSSSSSGGKHRSRGGRQSVSPFQKYMNHGKYRKQRSPSPERRRQRDNSCSRSRTLERSERRPGRQVSQSMTQDAARHKGAIPKQVTKLSKQRGDKERGRDNVKGERYRKKDPERSKTPGTETRLFAGDVAQQRQAEQAPRNVRPELVRLQPPTAVVTELLPTEGQTRNLITAYIVSENRDQILFLNVDYEEPKKEQQEEVIKSPLPKSKPREDSIAEETASIMSHGYDGLPSPLRRHTDDVVSTSSSEVSIPSSYDLVRAAVGVNPILTKMPSKKMVQLWKPKKFDQAPSDYNLSEEIDLAALLLKKLELRDACEEKEKKKQRKRREARNHSSSDSSD